MILSIMCATETSQMVSAFVAHSETKSITANPATQESPN
jgi:hypothetical protein